MRLLLLAFLVGCGHAATSGPPTNETSSSVGPAPSVDVTKLGGTVLIPTVGDNDITYAPHTDAFALDTNKVAAVSSTWTLVGTDGARVDVKAEKPTSVPYGCDNNQLEGMLLAPVGTGHVPAGVAWMMPQSASWDVKALPIKRDVIEKLRETYRIGDLTLKLERTQPSKGVATIENRGTKVEVTDFQRVIMEGADPALETIDFSDKDMRLQIPVPVAAWSLSPSGPYLLVLHTSGFEGASLETFLVDARPEQHQATKIESMAVYLYQCAF